MLAAANVDAYLPPAVLALAYDAMLVSQPDTRCHVRSTREALQLIAIARATSRTMPNDARMG